jgi:ribosome-interacting GTPase 1
VPANLPPDYFEAEKKLRTAKTPEDKVQVLKEMLAIMPKHKGTDRLQADLKRKIARLKDEAEERRAKGARRKSGLDSIEREGAAQIVLVGLPNSGKSSLVEAVTNALPEVADYPFTTRKPLPAMMPYEDIQFQLIDLPPVTPDLIEHWAVSLVRNSDAVLLVVDAARDDPAGEVESILRLLEERKVSVEGGRLPEVDEWSPVAYRRGLIVANKVDIEGAFERYRELSRLMEGRFAVVPFSCYNDERIPVLGRAIYDRLEVIRVYTKVPGKKADLDRPYVLRQGSTVIELAEQVHRDFIDRLKFARVWGSGKFDGQNVQRDYVMEDGDVVELHV